MEFFIEFLGLAFTLPGCPNIELVKDGANAAVTIDNVATYVDRVIDMTLGQVVRSIDPDRAHHHRHSRATRGYVRILSVAPRAQQGRKSTKGGDKECQAERSLTCANATAATEPNAGV